jgi:type I restriction enzyme M protein
MDLMSVIGQEEFNDFNQFVSLVNSALKELNRKLTSSELNALLNAVSWYDAGAEKVIKCVVKLNPEKLKLLLEHLGCQEAQLVDYGYFPTGRKGEYLQYETESDLRDFENILLKKNIYDYFLREVKPHVPEAWINLDSVKTGYEISFNKYFYKHKSLRSIEEVGADILRLEAESEGLINEILNLF